MKNIKSILFNGGSIVLSGLVLLFLSLPFANGPLGTSMSPYQLLALINQTGNGGDFEAIVMQMALILTIVFASVLMAAAILQLLVDFNVIKSEKFAKIIRITYFVTAIIVAVLALLNFIMLLIQAGRLNADGFSANIVVLIFGLIFGLATVATTFFAIRKSKKA